MKAFAFFVLLLSTLASYGQSFEGEIVYKNSYKSKSPNVTDEQMASMLGTHQDYFIKGGDYKSEVNGSFIQWQLYVNKDNKLYNKIANSETLLWNDGAGNPDTVLKAEVHKHVAEILGYPCDELVLTCTSGIEKFYYSTKLSVDPSLYVNHKFGNWYEIISRTKSLPLKYTLDNTQFLSESVATEVKPMKLAKTEFELPAGIKTAKSPY